MRSVILNCPDRRVSSRSLRSRKGSCAGADAKKLATANRGGRRSLKSDQVKRLPTTPADAHVRNAIGQLKAPIDLSLDELRGISQGRLDEQETCGEGRGQLRIMQVKLRRPDDERRRKQGCRVDSKCSRVSVEILRSRCWGEVNTSRPRRLDQPPPCAPHTVFGRRPEDGSQVGMTGRPGSLRAATATRKTTCLQENEKRMFPVAVCDSGGAPINMPW